MWFCYYIQINLSYFSEGPVPLGSLEINPLAKLTRMAGISGNNQATPSLADLEPDSDEEKTGTVNSRKSRPP